MPQPWHALLVPLPADAVVERRPVASAEQLAAGTAGPIAGWENLSVHLSDAGRGLRHVMITLDANGTLLSGGDGVLFERTEPRGAETTVIYDHHNIGGRFEDDGSFRGTVWHLQSEQIGDDVDQARTIASTSSAPTPDQVEALRALAAEIMRRAPAKRA
jgi:hypothetical protein